VDSYLKSGEVLQELNGFGAAALSIAGRKGKPEGVLGLTNTITHLRAGEMALKQEDSRCGIERARAESS